jgi:hypothetical protein
MNRIETAIVGACGEYYVASYLSGFSLLVAMPRAGIPGSDLYVSTIKDGPAIRIQVKTGTKSTRKDRQEGPIYLWHASFKAIDRVNDSLWYAYVWLNGWPDETKQPELFFIPSRVVSDCLKSEKEANVTMPFYWMRTPDAQKFKGEAGLKAMREQLEK